MGEKVFVNTAKDVLGAALGVAKANIAYKVDELAKALFIESGARVIFGKDTLEGRIVSFHCFHGLIHKATDGGLDCVILVERPAGLWRNLEDIEGAILVKVFGVGAVWALGLQAGMVFLKRI